MSFRTRLVLFALAYWAGAELVYAVPGNYADFWLPAGMLMAMLLRTPPRRWWAVCLAAASANFLADVIVHGQLWSLGVGYALINVIVPLLGAAFLIRWCRPAFSFGRLSHVLIWGFVVCVIVTLNALAGVSLKVVLRGDEFVQEWYRWTFGGLLGIIVSTPIVLSLLDWSEYSRRVRSYEALLLLLSMSVASGLLFSQTYPTAVPPGILFLFTMWAALRTGAVGVAVVSLLMLAIGLWFTASGLGPYSLMPDMESRMLNVQMLVAVSAFLSYILAAVMEERHAAESELRASNLHLDQQVKSRTADLTRANDQLHLAHDAAALGFWHHDLLGDLILFDERARVHYGLDRAEVTLPEVLKHIHPEDAQRLAQEIATVTGPDGDGKYSNEYRAVDAAGSVRWLAVNVRVVFDVTDGTRRAVLAYGTSQDITERKRQEEALRENQRFINSIIDTAPTVLYIFDLQHNRPTYLTEQGAAMLGYNGDEIKKDYDAFLGTFMHPDDARLADKHFRKVAATRGGKVFEFEYRMRHKSGEWRWFRSRDRVFKRDEKGQALEILGIALDITERKRQEEEIRISEARFRRVLAQSPAGIVQVDPSGRMTLVNQRWTEMLGYSREEMLTMNVMDVTHSSSQEATLAVVGKLAAGGPDFEIEKNYRRKDGSVMPALSNVSSLRGSDGEYQGLVAVVIDLTDRLKAEAESQQLASIVESSSDAIISTDFDGTIRSWNSAAKRIFGHTEAEAVGQDITMLFPPDRIFEIENIREAIAHGQALSDFETVRRRKDGTDFPVSITASPIRKETGELIGISRIIRDITDRKSAEILRRQHESLAIQAEFAEAERIRLARDLHDHIGQQVTGLRLMLANLKASKRREEQIVQTIDGLLRQTETLDRDLSHLAFELRPLPLKQDGLAAGLSNYVKNWSSNFQIPAECIVELESAQQLSAELEVNLYRIVQEALNNTSKYANAKTANVILRVTDNVVRLIIEDDGIGFDTKAARQTTKERGGGLGLLGMQERVNLLNGSLELESNPGSGTTIFVTAPATY